jgi:DNA (cytosine-5)-methyltransferase 1
MNKLKLLDLFSGIGGFSLGLESTGYFQTIAFVEKDKFCRQVLQKNFKNIPIEEDIRNVRGSNYAADVITGGFPCQPFSVAGKRKGTADDRYLWDETIRVVAECKPSWFIGENVEGLININNGVVLRQVQTDLEKQGFQVQCLVISAAGIGAWHQRKRIWIVAYSDSNRHSNKIRGSSTKEERISQEHRQDHNTTRKSSGASSIWETNNQHVPNPSSQRPFTRNNREMETKTRDKKETGDQSSLQTLSSCSDVPNTKSSRTWKDERGIWQRFSGVNGGEGTDKDVSNSKSKGSFSTSESKPSSEERTRLDINKKKNWGEIWSYASRCNEQVGSRKETIQHTNSERCEELNISQKSNGQNFCSGEFNSTETIKTWWQTQSEFCGVPNGVSYELDKDRSSRIKALGNSIVPQIARQIGLSIMKGELTNNE